MVYLADINLLIALADPAHAGHQGARAWLSRHRDDGLATCALTENGFLRIYGHVNYPGGPGSLASARQDLHVYRSRKGHRFFPCNVSIDDRRLFPDLGAVAPRHLTDLYLLALAGCHEAKFATMDTGIPARLVTNGEDWLERVATH